jgi:glutamyl-tRNA synthetase
VRLHPGTCRNREVEVARAWRLRVPEGPIEFDDLFAGRGSYDTAATVGDFVVAKTPEWPAYQLAVVIDDIAQGVTEVVRGDDLMASTARQILVYRALGMTPPRTGHAPLVVGEDGKRLAKRNSATHIGTLRAAGVKPQKIIAALARWSGLPEKGTPAELIGDWDWRRLSRDRIVLTPDRIAELT